MMVAQDVRGLELGVEQFDLGRHNGVVTVENVQSGGWRSFRVYTVKEGDLAGRRLVALLTGPENEEDWRPFGFVEGPKILLWKQYRSSVYEKYARLLVEARRFAAEKGLRYLIAARCRRCNRSLTTPASIDRGLGEKCAGMPA